MARIRSIKPEFWSSPGTASASPMARLLFIAMWNWADDYGVGTANLKELEGFAYPNDAVADFPSLCTEVADSFDVTFYTVRGRPYYSIPSWDKHQRNERRAHGLHPGLDEADMPPDLQERGASDSTHGTSDDAHGLSAQGTGEQGNRGTGEQGKVETSSPAPPSRPTPSPPGFDEFWQAYPRKVGKQAAIKRWHKAIKITSRSALIQGALRLAQDPNRSDEYTPHPSTWLNEGRWDDDPLPSRDRPLRSTTDERVAAVQALKNSPESARKALT